MDRQEFETRFYAVLADATASAAITASVKFPTPTHAKLLWASHAQRVMPVQEAVSHLYLGPSVSYAIVDVGVIIEGPDAGVAWLVPSGHEPRAYEDIWDAEGHGPFKHVEWVKAGFN